MLSSQIDRILLIEKFMNAVWNIGKSGFRISGTAKSIRIMGNILDAVINKVELTVGLTTDDHIPPREAANFPYELVEELRQANITVDDLNKINQRRAANKEIVVYLAETLLAKAYRDFGNMELHIWEVSHGDGSNYFSADDIQKIRDANFVKIDLSGFFTVSRVSFFQNFFFETILNYQQILSMSLPLSEQAQFAVSERLLYQKTIIENDFVRLREHGVSVADTVADIINLGKGIASKYNHIRPSNIITSDRFFPEYIDYIARHMIINLGRNYKNIPLAEVPAPAAPPAPVIPKTAAELSAEKNTRDSAYQSLIRHFNLEPEDARRVADTTDINNLHSLWHIKTKVMPGITKVLAEMMEQFSGNIQMVEDLVVFEQVIWSNETRAWEKYRIPAQHLNTHAKSMTSYVSKEHSDTLLGLNLNLTLPLIKPLRKNLTSTYQANHPGATIVVGRDLELFKKYTLIHSWKVIPEFMFDNRNVIAIINSTKPNTVPTSEPLPLFNDNNYKETTFASDQADLTIGPSGRSLGGSIVLAGDIIILGSLVMLMLYSFRKPLNYWRKTLFGIKQDTQYGPVSMHTDERTIDIKINRFG